MNRKVVAALRDNKNPLPESSYGSVNLLSFGASQESVMRLESGSIARALVGEK